LIVEYHHLNPHYRLLEVCIPEFGREIDGRKEASNSVSFSTSFLVDHFSSMSIKKTLPSCKAIINDMTELITALHLRGINVRYLMILFENIKENEYYRRIIITEMVARTCKNILREKWRQLRRCDDDGYIVEVADYFSLVFSATSSASKSYWEKELSDALFARFLNANRSQHTPRFSLLQFVLLQPLFYRLQEVLGVSITFETVLSCHQETDVQFEDITQILNCDDPIKPEHVRAIEAKVKHVHMISFEQGTALSRMAMTLTSSLLDDNRDENSSSEEKLIQLAKALDLLQQASTKYQQSLAVKPNDYRSLYNWGNTLIETARLRAYERKLKKIGSHSSFEVEWSGLFDSSYDKFEKCVLLHSGGSNIECGWVFWKWGSALMEHARGVSKYLRATTLEGEQNRHRKEEYLLREACSKLTEACKRLLPHVDNSNQSTLSEFDLLFNQANAYLRLSTLLLSMNHHVSATTEATTKSSGLESKREVLSFLSTAISKFEAASRLTSDERLASALHNLGASLAKKARLLSSLSKEENGGKKKATEAYKESCRVYERALSAVVGYQHPDLHFDYGNALYRYAVFKKKHYDRHQKQDKKRKKEKEERSAARKSNNKHLLDIINLLFRSADHYKDALQLLLPPLDNSSDLTANVVSTSLSVFGNHSQLRNDSFKNVGVVITTLLSLPLNVDFSSQLAKLATFYLSLFQRNDLGIFWLIRSENYSTYFSTETRRQTHVAAVLELMKQSSLDNDSTSSFGASPLSAVASCAHTVYSNLLSPSSAGQPKDSRVNGYLIELDWKKPTLYHYKSSTKNSSESLNMSSFDCVSRLSVQRSVDQVNSVSPLPLLNANS